MLAMLDLELEKDYVQGSLGLWRYCDNMPVSIKFNKSEDQIKNSLLMIKSEKFMNEKTPLPSKFNKNEGQTKNSLLTIKPEKIVNGNAPVRNTFDKNEEQIKKPLLLVDQGKDKFFKKLDSTNLLKHIQTAFCKILDIPAIFMIKSGKVVNGEPLVLNKSDKNEFHIKNSLLKHIQTAFSKRSDIPAFFMAHIGCTSEQSLGSDRYKQSWDCASGGMTENKLAWIGSNRSLEQQGGDRHGAAGEGRDGNNGEEQQQSGDRNNGEEQQQGGSRNGGAREDGDDNKGSKKRSESERDGHDTRHNALREALKQDAPKLIRHERDFKELYDIFHSPPFQQCFRCPSECEWINTPCGHKLWCTDCRKWAAQVVGNHPHLCVACNRDVTTLIQTDPTPVRAEVGSSSSFHSPEIPCEGNEDSHLMTSPGETDANSLNTSDGYEVSNSLGIPSSRIPRESIQLSPPMNFLFESDVNPSDGYGVSRFLGTFSSGIPREVLQVGHSMTSHGETDANSLNTSDGYEVSNSLRESIQHSPPMSFHFESHVNPSDGYGVSRFLGTFSSGIPREVVQGGPSMSSPGETDVNSLNTSDGYEVGNSLGIPPSSIPRESIQLCPPMTSHFESHINPSDGYGVSRSLGTSSSGIPREVVQGGPSMTSHGETDVNLSNPSSRYISCSIRTSLSGIIFLNSEIKVDRPIDPQARKKQLRKKKQEARDLSRKKNDNHDQQ